MASWNSFMWPQVVINNTIKTNSTLPLALSRIGGEVERQDNVIMAGADATGCTSGIIKAPDPKKMADDMLHALRAAWDERHRT